MKDEGGIIRVAVSNKLSSKFEGRRGRVGKNISNMSMLILILLIRIKKHLSNNYGNYSGENQLHGHIAGQ